MIKCDDEESNDQQVVIKVIDDKGDDDKENDSTLSNKNECQPKKHWNKNRSTIDIDDINNSHTMEPSATKLTPTRLIEASRTMKKEDTVIIHNDESCLTNVYNEFDEQSVDQSQITNDDTNNETSFMPSEDLLIN